jgi:hypothetical protein
VDGRGVPLSIIVTAANVNDGKRIEEVLLAIVVKRKRTPQRCGPSPRPRSGCARLGPVMDRWGYLDKWKEYERLCGLAFPIGGIHG